MGKRLEPKARRDEILDAAVKLAAVVGWRELTRDGVAEAAGVSGALVNVYFGTVETLKQKVMKEAVKLRILSIVAQGLADHDIIATTAPARLKSDALKTLA